MASDSTICRASPVRFSFGHNWCGLADASSRPSADSDGDVFEDVQETTKAEEDDSRSGESALVKEGHKPGAVSSPAQDIKDKNTYGGQGDV